MKKQYRFAATVLLSLLAIVANAAVVVMEYEFSRPQLTAEFNGDILVMENCRTGGAPGAPALPAFGVKLLLPPGEAADAVEVYPGEPQLLTSGARIAPNQVQLPFSYEGDITLIDENSTIYQLDELYPAQLYQMPQTQYFRGHSLACFLINPVSYNPVRGEIWWYPQMRIEVHTSPAAVAAVSLHDYYRADQATFNQLQGMVDNISLQQQYPAAPADRLEEMDMVIITSNPLSSSFEPLADFNNRRGIHTFIETTNWIYTHVDGLDNQDRIRNFIIDCYQNLSIRFVLLGVTVMTPAGVISSPTAVSKCPPTTTTSGKPITACPAISTTGGWMVTGTAMVTVSMANRIRRRLILSPRYR